MVELPEDGWTTPAVALEMGRDFSFLGNPGNDHLPWAKEFKSVDVAGAGRVVTVDKPQEFIEAPRSLLRVLA